MQSDSSATLCPLYWPLQVRTALNMLGPLLNPAHAAYGLVGTYSTDISELMAGSLLVRGDRRQIAAVVRAVRERYGPY